MNILLLGITNNAFIESIKSIKNITITESFIERPVLYPFPNIVIVDFEKATSSNDNEKVLTEIATHIVPKPYIIACMAKWDPSYKTLAKCFGVNRIFTYEDNEELSYIIEKLT